VIFIPIEGGGVSNPNPYKARLSKALRRKPGAIDDILRRTWGVLCLAYDEIALAEDGESRRKRMLAFGQLASAYSKLYELHVVEVELAQLEETMSQGNGHVK